MKILGIDFGEKKIGLAISEGKLATPLGIQIRGKNPQVQIKNFCQKEKIKRIILGVSEGKMAKTQKKFGRNLAKISRLPVEFWDETLTSKEAVKKMVEAKVPKEKRKLKEHAVAAALILQSYLDSKNGDY